MERLVAKIQNEVRHNLKQTGFGSDKKLVVAVSGGPDSLTLLDSLIATAPKQKLTLHAAHLNHSIREESVDIAIQMREMFMALGIGFSISVVDAPALHKESRQSLEEAARYLRYQFLVDVSDREQADAIAIAHTLDDQAETVLLHLLRGSGINGLAGIRSMFQGQVYPDLKSARFIRPLLSVTKDQTAQYCSLQGLNPEHDYTNDSSIYLRNRIRHQLLPELTEYNPAIKNTLVQTAQIAAETTDLLDSLVQGSWDNVVEKNDVGSVLKRDEFRKLHPAVRSQLLRVYLNQERGSLKDIDYRHLQQILRLMDGPTGKYTLLPGGQVFKVDGLFGRFSY